MPAAPYQLVSQDALVALTEFGRDFDAALVTAPVEKWAERIGLVNTSKAIKTTYPIPVSAAGYRERLGDDQLRELFERSLSMSPREWSDGFSALARVIEAPDFVGFSGEAQRIAAQAAKHSNKLVAAMLKANPLLDLYKAELPGGVVPSTVRLFSDSHPVNIFDASFGTFDNDHSATAIDATMFSATKIRFGQKKAPNGESLGLTFDTLLVPLALGEQAKDFLESDMMIIALQEAGANVAATNTNNRHKGTVELIIADELLDDDVVYPMCLRQSVYPWIVQNGGSPEQILYDKTDALYKDKGRVGMKFILTAAVQAALPHAIERVTITG